MLERLNKSGLARLWRAIQVKLSEKQDSLQDGRGTVLNNDSIDIVGSRVLYGTCSTGETTAAKSITCPEFSSLDKVSGTVIFVLFQNGNTVNNITFTINGVSCGGLAIAGSDAYLWQSGDTVPFIYDGSLWHTLDESVATTSYYGKVKLSSSTSSTTSSGVAATPAAVSAVGSKSVYCTCSTSVDVTDKVATAVDCSNFQLLAGQTVAINFVYGLSLGDEYPITSININNTGQVPVKRGNQNVSILDYPSTRTGVILSFVYTGSVFELLSDNFDSNMYKLTAGSILDYNADLNNYYQVGSYQYYNDDISSMSNTPYTYNGAFKLLVEDLSSYIDDTSEPTVVRCIKQTFIPVSNTRLYFRLGEVRSANGYDSVTWENWHYMFSENLSVILKGDSNFRIDSNIDTQTAPASTILHPTFSIRSTDNEEIVNLRAYQTTTNDVGVNLATSRSVSNDTITHGVSLKISDDGTRSVSFNEVAPWLTALQIDKWVNTSTYITAITSVITAGTNITINAAQYVQFGKIAQIYISWKSSAAISVPANGNITDVNVGTLVSGKRPKVLTFGMSNGANPASGGAFYSISTAGTVTLTSLESTGSARTIAANTNCYVMATYILA